MFDLSVAHDHDASFFAPLYASAFGPGRRARTAERLRERNAPIAALTHIATDEAGGLIGSIHFWPIRIGAASALLLGPLAVAPHAQGKGVGLALMQASLAVLDANAYGEADDFAGVLLVGDAPYYARVGFAPVPLATVIMPGPVDMTRLLYRPRRAGDGAQAVPRGPARAAPELTASPF